MRLVLLLAAALAVAGCGDDSGVSADMPQFVYDLSLPGLHCGGVTCTGDGCVACVEVLGGVCAPPCRTSDSPTTCTGGATCRSANAADGGTSNVTFAGNCSGFDGVCL
jgi:hypothetical protein